MIFVVCIIIALREKREKKERQEKWNSQTDGETKEIVRTKKLVLFTKN